MSRESPGGAHFTRVSGVYVAPPDRHLVVRGPRLLVGQGARENGVRPSIDVLFRSAALAFGRRTVAVVLSGARDDGVAGASAVGACGGCVLVQSPDDAPFASMPAATVARDHPDRVLPLAELAAAVADAVGRLSEETPMRDNGTDEMSLEPEYATISPGVLGAAPAGESVEAALWTALRTLQERAQLSERLAARVGNAGARRRQTRFEASAREARERADAIRRVLAGSGSHG